MEESFSESSIPESNYDPEEFEVYDAENSSSESSKISGTENVKESEEESGEYKNQNSLSEKFEIEKFELFGISDCEIVSEHEEKEKSQELSESEIAQTKRKWEFHLKDTLRCKSFLHKLVKAKTTNGLSYLGFLEYLDPETGDMIIVNTDNGISYHNIIFQDTCLSVTIVDENDIDTDIVEVYPHVNTKLLKNRLISAFKEQQIPIKEERDGSLSVGDYATINKPYQPLDCMCDNPIMLEQTKMMVSSLQDISTAESETDDETETNVESVGDCD